jgi:hypothetical protein
MQERERYEERRKKQALVSEMYCCRFTTLGKRLFVPLVLLLIKHRATLLGKLSAAAAVKLKCGFLRNSHCFYCATKASDHSDSNSEQRQLLLTEEERREVDFKGGEQRGLKVGRVRASAELPGSGEAF